MKILTTIATLITFALQLLGSSYSYGCIGPNYFDCSGFTYYCYKEAIGVEIPRTAYDQGYCEEYEKIETIAALEPGDLIFFNTKSDKDYCDHVAIYLGDNEFIHSSSAKGEVIITELQDTWYEGAFSWGRRIIDN